MSECNENQKIRMCLDQDKGDLFNIVSRHRLPSFLLWEKLLDGGNVPVESRSYYRYYGICTPLSREAHNKDVCLSSPYQNCKIAEATKSVSQILSKFIFL